MASCPSSLSPCQKCSGPKPLGRGRRYCDQCRPVFSTDKLARDKANQKRLYSDPEWVENKKKKARSVYAANAEHERERSRQNHLWYLYRMSVSQFNALLAAQDGRCASCGTDEPNGNGWHVDHDHACCPGERSCGECIRGILCGNCNQGLGNFGDDPERLLAAVRYLLKGDKV